MNIKFFMLSDHSTHNIKLCEFGTRGSCNLHESSYAN